MFIELTRESDSSNVTVSLKHIIRFSPTKEGCSSVVSYDGSILYVKESYEEIKEILEDQFI